MEKIGVMGAGSWGTALAISLGKKGYPVYLWARDNQTVKEIKNKRENSRYLARCRIPDTVKPTQDIQEALEQADVIVLSVPSHAVREVARQCSPYIKPGKYIVNTAKGFELETLKVLTSVIEEELIPQLRENIVVLSGPSHAEEVGLGMPTTVVAAAEKRQAAEYIQNIFMSDTFRVYTNPDIIGVQLAGALKNVIALATGISDGLGFGDNTKAALMTRGIAEITRLGIRMGAEAMTFAGLSGIGDLIVTCTSMHSRNRRAGIQLGEGKSLEEVLEHMGMVVEGVRTAKAAHRLSQKYKVEMPIIEHVYKVLFEGLDADKAVNILMMRGKKHEMEEVVLSQKKWK